MLDLTPNPVALQIGPLPLYWYGIGYAVGLASAYLMMVRQAKRAGENPDVIGNGIIIVAIAALAGGRLYHVIDQWALYKDDPLKIVRRRTAASGSSAVSSPGRSRRSCTPVTGASRSCAGRTSSRRRCS